MNQLPLPLTVLVIMVGLWFLQQSYFKFQAQQRIISKTILGSGEIEKLRKEFDDYKSRVDKLSLKVGFRQ